VKQENSGKFSQKQISNFVLCKNYNAPKDEELPFNLGRVLKKAAEFLKP
jgi:hypothetical protein